MEKDEKRDWEKKEDYWKDQIVSYEEYRKRNPLKKGKKRVSQRGKEGFITVESPFSSFPRKQGPRVPLHPELNGVLLKVTATPKAWKKIESFTLDHPDWFGLEFHSHFANPAVLKISDKNKPRGRQKTKYHFVNKVKIRAGILYAFLKYWCRHPVREWPEYLKRIAEMVKKEGHEDYLKQGTTYRSKELTAYIIDKMYGREAKEIGLASFFEYEERESLDNFYFTYIQDKRRPARITPILMKNRTPQEVAQLVHTTPALRAIFETLQVL